MAMNHIATMLTLMCFGVEYKTMINIKQSRFISHKKQKKNPKIK